MIVVKIIRTYYSLKPKLTYLLDTEITQMTCHFEFKKNVTGFYKLKGLECKHLEQQNYFH